MYTTLICLANRYNCKIIKSDLCNENLINDPFFSFHYIQCGSERIIYSMKENKKWIFFEKGKPLDIENLNYYKKRIIKQRMNNEIIIEYLEKMKINLNKQFFLSEKSAKYFEKREW